MSGINTSFTALAAWSALAIGPAAGKEQISPEMAVERAMQCGLGPVTIRYEDDLQSDVLTVASAASATENQLRCLDRAVGWGFLVELPQSVQSRFDAIREARASEMMLAEARAWLSERKLLHRVPKYVEGITDDAVFTRKIERLCGPAAKGAFQSSYGLYVLSPDWIIKLGTPPGSKGGDAMSCLLNATAVAGFKVGLIGNQAYAPNE